jgi:hypothetical protein
MSGIMKNKWWFLLLALGFLACVSAVRADGTNAIPPIVPVDAITVTSFWSSIGAALHFLGLTPTEIGYILLALHVIARYVRNYLLTRYPGLVKALPRISGLIAHMAINPLPAVAGETKQ